MVALGTALLVGGSWLARVSAQGAQTEPASSGPFDDQIRANAQSALAAGRKTFRFDTFGDEEFWGGTLHLQRAIEGERLGGEGSGLSPKAALNLGLKVDVTALPPQVISALRQETIDLDDPASGHPRWSASSSKTKPITATTP